MPTLAPTRSLPLDGVGASSRLRGGYIGRENSVDRRVSGPRLLRADPLSRCPVLLGEPGSIGVRFEFPASPASGLGLGIRSGRFDLKAYEDGGALSGPLGCPQR